MSGDQAERSADAEVSEGPDYKGLATEALLVSFVVALYAIGVAAERHDADAAE